MTKEEIYNKHLEKIDWSLSVGEIIQCFYNAMDQYAKEQSMAFHTWLMDNYDYNEFNKKWGKFWEIDEGVNEGFDSIEPEKLYQAFLEHQSKQL